MKLGQDYLEQPLCPIPSCRVISRTISAIDKTCPVCGWETKLWKIGKEYPGMRKKLIHAAVVDVRLCANPACAVVIFMLDKDVTSCPLCGKEGKDYSAAKEAIRYGHST